MNFATEEREAQERKEFGNDKGMQDMAVVRVYLWNIKYGSVFFYRICLCKRRALWDVSLRGKIDRNRPAAVPAGEAGILSFRGSRSSGCDFMPGRRGWGGKYCYGTDRNSVFGCNYLSIDAQKRRGISVI